MAQGQYDHPSYLTRNTEQFGSTTAGNGAISQIYAAPFALRIRHLVGLVRTAGTSAGAGLNMIQVSGTTTTTLGSVVLGTGAEYTIGTSSDLNVTVPAGVALAIQNAGTDATFVGDMVMEYHIDPVTGTWSGP